MKTKGFTLVELLVVIAIMALLMGILLPALAKVRQLAYRMACGANQRSVGSAMMVYASDNKGKYPVAGGNLQDTEWGYYDSTSRRTPKVTRWDALDEGVAYHQLPGPPTVSVSSSLYLLVKYAEMMPEQFICKSDISTTDFKLSQEPVIPPDFELTDAWDFGSFPAYAHCSFAYQVPFVYQSNETTPFGVINDVRHYYTLNENSDTRLAVLADRNPYIEQTEYPAAEISGGTGGGSGAVVFDWDGNVQAQKNGNSPNHQLKGQNVLFMDGSVEFEKFSFCALENDNIYTRWGSAGATYLYGTKPTLEQRQEGEAMAIKRYFDALKSPKDSLLINDGPK